MVTVVAERIPTRVEGLDPLIQGGLQVGDFVLLVGGIGTGKTIFSSQFVYNSAKYDNEHAVLATFEEDVRSLKRNMRLFGMDFDTLEKEKKVKVMDLESLEGRGMGSNIETLLAALDEIKAKRLVVDSLTAFLSGAKEKFDYSFLMHLIYKTLKREGITTLMTVSKFQADQTMTSGIEEFVADGIFQLENYVVKGVELRTRFLIKKLRGTEHSRKYHTVAFTPTGLNILPYSD
jgi:circadian clock protein KaiC